MICSSPINGNYMLDPLQEKKSLPMAINDGNFAVANTTFYRWQRTINNYVIIKKIISDRIFDF